ncbi:MAG: peptidoglycan D,D-transpeptidase FtsI family protein [Solirubrobacterales bacterium]
MNTQIVKLFGLLLGLYALLVGFTSYWSIFDAEGLEQNPDNRRPLLLEQKIERGEILTVDGQVIARSVPEGRAGDEIFVRRYPQGDLYGNPIGYSFLERGRVGFELSHNDELVGNKTEFLSVLDELQGHEQVGSNVFSSIDSEAQRVATDALAGQPGSVVAIVPDTGEIRAMVSVPTYDPNEIRSNEAFQKLNTADPPAIINRATQSVYPPGSTMKVVTATAALESGDFNPDTVLNADSPKTISGVPLENAGGESFGDIAMTDALTNSVNTYWAQVGEDLGTETMYRYMDRYGFNQLPDIDYPEFQLSPSGEYSGGDLLGSGSDEIDVGRMAIGQDKLLVTPLQMAQVAATVANDGERMCPRLWSKVVDSDQRTEELGGGDRCARVMDEDTAETLTQMMTDVVNEGTGGAAALADDQVAGKTGTAEIFGREGCAEDNQAWFIGFAPADDPEIAVAATVECTSGAGGEVAAPIAQQVMEVLLADG